MLLFPTRIVALLPPFRCSLQVLEYVSYMVYLQIPPPCIGILSIFPKADFDLAEPRASAMIESLRAFGYSLEAAVADLIDNSISASASNVWLSFKWEGEDSTVAIQDDGDGMSDAELKEAMRPGTRSP